MFVRIKKIKGFPYAYLVRNKWKKGKTMQKTVKYLGKVIETNQNEIQLKNLIPKFHSINSAKELFTNLVKKQLEILGFKPKSKNVYFNQEMNLQFNFKSFSFKQNNKICILKVNNGFLCSFNLKKLGKAIEDCVSCRDEDFYIYGKELAKTFVDSGFLFTKEQFQTLIVILFQLREKNANRVGLTTENNFKD